MYFCLQLGKHACRNMLQSRCHSLVTLYVTGCRLFWLPRRLNLLGVTFLNLLGVTKEPGPIVYRSSGVCTWFLPHVDMYRYRARPRRCSWDKTTTASAMWTLQLLSEAVANLGSYHGVGLYVCCERFLCLCFVFCLHSVIHSCCASTLFWTPGK